MQPTDALTGIVKNGVLVLGGFVTSIRVDMEQLVVRDGVRGKEVERRFSRARCPVSRIIATRAEGYITLEAVRWMDSVGVTFVQLDYDGTPLLMSLPKTNVRAGLRRKQALTTSETPHGASIARSLIAAKVVGQVDLLKRLMHAAAVEASAYAARIASDITMPDLLGIEGMVAALYWNALAGRPLQFGRRQAVPDHWRAFGSRHSPLTGTARRAVTPGGAVLNYIYSVAASEIAIALHAIGLDPALGVLHEDKDNRMSLAYDLIEPARPAIIDRWFFEWLDTATFSKGDFIEHSFGGIRLMHPLTSYLAMTSSLWRSMADDMVQWFYTRLTQERSRASIRLRNLSIPRDRGRRAAQWMPGNSMTRPIPSTCMECGKVLTGRQRKFCGYECMIAYRGDDHMAALRRGKAERSVKGEDRPSRPRQSHINAISVSEWQQQPDWSPESDAKMRTWYAAEVLPRLKAVRSAAIRKETGVSSNSSKAIKYGRRIPHPRHHRALAALAGVAWPFFE